VHSQSRSRFNQLLSTRTIGIEGSEHWQGHQYEVFRSYHPEWHDAGWYHSRYPNVTLIAGGYYFFNNNGTGSQRGVTALQLNIMPTMDRSMWSAC
jgi:hypothetical protein